MRCTTTRLQTTVIEKNRTVIQWTKPGLSVGEVWNSESGTIGSARRRICVLLGAGFFDPTDRVLSNVLAGNNIATVRCNVADVFLRHQYCHNVLRDTAATGSTSAPEIASRTR